MALSPERTTITPTPTLSGPLGRCHLPPLPPLVAHPPHSLLAAYRNGREGVLAGHCLRLQLVGVGYRLWVAGAALLLDLGGSGLFLYRLPSTVAAAGGRTGLLLWGVDRQAVAAVAADLSRLRRRDAYGGKGVRLTAVAPRLKRRKKDSK